MTEKPERVDEPAPLDQPATEADDVAAAVLACPGIVALDAGGVTQVATYLRGRRVVGVRLGDEAIEVAVVAALGTPIAEVDAQVRDAVAPHARGRRVDLQVVDVQPVTESGAAQRPGASRA